METKSKYGFSWDMLGDIKLGRPNLGPNTRLEVYRLMQFCFRDVIEKAHGTEEADRIFYDSGYLAGTHFYANLIEPVQDLKEFVSKLQSLLRDLQIGILHIEETDLEKDYIIISISEDLECSGLPEKDYKICTYDEGFIAALMDSFTGRRFKVKEIDCWGTGDRTCRYKVQIESQ